MYQVFNLKYCIFIVWQSWKSVQTIFSGGFSSIGTRDITPENEKEADSQEYSQSNKVWRSLVEHELLHSLVSEYLFNRESLVLTTEAGKNFHFSALRYEEESIVLAFQLYFNTKEKLAILYRLEKEMPVKFSELVASWDSYRARLEEEVFQ